VFPNWRNCAHVKREDKFILTRERERERERGDRHEHEEIEEEEFKEMRYVSDAYFHDAVAGYFSLSLSLFLSF